MKIGQQINCSGINKQANSLYSLITDVQYCATSLGRDTWKQLIGPHNSFQPNCNMEGPNARCTTKSIRIGILCNNEDDYITCENWIWCRHLCWRLQQCQNVALHGGDNGDRNIRAMGCILVQ